jgi:hypothetical protein
MLDEDGSGEMGETGRRARGRPAQIGILCTSILHLVIEKEGHAPIIWRTVEYDLLIRSRAGSSVKETAGSEVDVSIRKLDTPSCIWEV